MKKTLERYMATKSKKSFRVRHYSIEDIATDKILSVTSKDKNIDGRYLLISREELFYTDWNGYEQMIDGGCVIRMLLFNCSSKWLENYIDVDFRTLEIIKDELGVLVYNELIWRFAEENLNGGRDKLARLAVEHYDWDYFDLVEFEDIFIYKLNTKVEY